MEAKTKKIEPELETEKKPEKKKLEKKKLEKKKPEPEKTQLRLEDAIEPLGPRLLVIRDTPEAITEKGIIIPTLAQDRPNVGTVVRAGEGCMNTWETGDRVLITEAIGREITVARWTVVLLDEDDILMRFSRESGV